MDVAHGLGYLHSLNFIRGDLKGVRQLDLSHQQIVESLLIGPLPLHVLVTDYMGL